MITDWVALDTETTGFGTDARIIEIAVVQFFEGEVVRTFSTLLQPLGVDWDNPDVMRAMELNGIRKQDLRAQPFFADIVDRLNEEMAVPVWVAHNAEFDLRMLRQELGRLKETRPKLYEPEMVFDTLHLDAHLEPKVEGKRKLEDIIRRWGVTMDGTAHRAAADAAAAGRAFGKMLARLPKTQSELKETIKVAETKWTSRFRKRGT